MRQPEKLPGIGKQRRCIVASAFLSITFAAALVAGCAKDENDHESTPETGGDGGASILGGARSGASHPGGGSLIHTGGTASGGRRDGGAGSAAEPAGGSTGAEGDPIGGLGGTIGISATSGGVVATGGLGGSASGGSPIASTAGSAGEGGEGGEGGAYVSILPWTCGDGLIEGAERCDDGNRHNLDGCSERCTIEECEICAEVTTRIDIEFRSTFIYGCFAIDALEERERCLLLDACLVLHAQEAFDYLLEAGAISTGPGLSPFPIQIVDYCYVGPAPDGMYWADLFGNIVIGLALPTGPCREAFEVAAGTEDPLQIAARFNDVSSTTGRAVVHLACERGDGDACGYRTNDVPCVEPCALDTTISGAGGQGTGGVSGGTGGLSGGTGGAMPTGGTMTTGGTEPTTGGASHAGTSGHGGAGGEGAGSGAAGAAGSAGVSGSGGGL
ncbi:MAG: DUF4215 domain-containing protein [Polyangiaceae bacterium]|nr:DUF4215 domain-containing protein [Polyangiaceae bacterium]